jgi:hypothetical protein
MNTGRPLQTAFVQLWDRERMSPQLARHVLKLKFNQRELERIRELRAKNLAGQIKADEQQELDNYLEADLTLSILHARAKRLLKAAQ